MSFSNNVGNVASELRLIYSAIHGLIQCGTRQKVVPLQKPPKSARFHSLFCYNVREF